MSDLLREYRRLMTQLVLLGDGAVMQFDRDSVRGGEKAQAPSGTWARFDGLPLCSQLALEWLKVDGVDARWDLIRKYEHACQEFKGGEDHRRNEKLEVESPTDRAKRIVRKGEGWTVHEVVLGLDMVDLTAQEVRRARSEADRDPMRGFPLPTDADDRTRVLELHGRKCTVRQIAAQTGVSKSTVDRWLKEAA